MEDLKEKGEGRREKGERRKEKGVSSDIVKFEGSKVRKDLDVDNPVQAAKAQLGVDCVIETSSVGAQQLTSYGTHDIYITSTPSCTYGLHGVIRVEALSGFLKPSHFLRFEEKPA